MRRKSLRPWWAHPLIRFLVLVPLYFGFTAVNSGPKKTAKTKMQDEPSCRSRVVDRAEEVCPLMVGMSVPKAELQNLKGQKKRISELIQGERAALIFYRGGWCPYCNLHLKELAQVEGALKKLGVELYAISPDRPEELSKSIKKHELKYQLLSDSQLDVAKAFGLVFQVSDKTLKSYKKFGIDLEKASGESHHQLPVPAVYLVDSSGMIQFQYVNPNYKVRLSGEQILEAAKRLK